MGARPRNRCRAAVRSRSSSGIFLTTGHVLPTGLAIPVLHAVTNDEIVARADFLERARRVMHEMRERGALHLRAPKMMDERGEAVVELALALAEEQERTGAWLVVNDRVDVALIVYARAVQLTGQSLEVTDAAKVIVDSCERTGSTLPAIGASVHSLEEAIAARIGGAAWGVVRDVLGAEGANRGPDRRRDVSGPMLLGQLVRFSGMPIVAIGGVLPRHVAELRRMGAYGAAAIRGIWDVEHSERAVIDYLSAYDSEVG